MLKQQQQNEKPNQQTNKTKQNQKQTYKQKTLLLTGWSASNSAP